MNEQKKTINTQLMENSLAAILSAIEIYNKPDFKYRNEVFVILLINGWELLLKAKVLKDNQDNPINLYKIEKTTGAPKRKRSSGQNITKSIGQLLKELSIDPTIKNNLYEIIKIRDSAVHFYHNNDI
ncbi:DUF3644 domain-containing protein, partial [bacterium]|nr:DUF3644 domain-containing protein [bacterium]